MGTFALVHSNYDIETKTWAFWHIVCIQSHIAVAALLSALDRHQCLTSVCCYVFISHAEHVCLNSSDTSVGVSCRSQIFALCNIPLKYYALSSALSCITVLFAQGGQQNNSSFSAAHHIHNIKTIYSTIYGDNIHNSYCSALHVMWHIHSVWISWHICKKFEFLFLMSLQSHNNLSVMFYYQPNLQWNEEWAILEGDKMREIRSECEFKWSTDAALTLVVYTVLRPKRRDSCRKQRVQLHQQSYKTFSLYWWVASYLTVAPTSTALKMHMLI